MTLSPATLLSLVAWEPLAKGTSAPTPVKLGPPPAHHRVENPYQGTIDFQGLVVYVENRKGSIRRGVAPDGTAWAVKMGAHYGEFADTLGVDGDPVDVFVGPDADAPTAYVIHRKHPGTEVFDEDKAILGCGSAKEAEALFRENYDKPGNLGGVTPWPVAELREYLQAGRGRGERLDQPARVRIMLRKAAPLTATFKVTGVPLPTGARLRAMFKATIRTPVGSDGKVDYDRVPVGASIWVSVKSGPLAGRPILITKRPDHGFALTGGSAAKYILARKHLVTSHGKPRATQADEAELTRRQEAEEKNEPIRKQVRAIRKQARGLQSEATAKWMESLGIRSESLSKEEKARVVDAARAHGLASGLDEKGAEALGRFVAEGIARKDDEHRAKKAAGRLEVARKIAAGQSPEEAAALAKPEPVAPSFTLPVVEPEVWNGMNDSEREHLVLSDLDAQERKHELGAIDDSRFDESDLGEPEDEEPAAAPEPVVTPTLTETGAPAMQGGAAELPDVVPGAEGAADFHGGHRPEEEPEAPAPALDTPTAPTFTVGSDDGAVAISGVGGGEPTPAAPVDSTPSSLVQEPQAFVSREKADEALRHFRSFAEAKKLERAAAGAMEKLPPMESAMPTALEDLRLRAGVATEEEVGQVLDEYVRQALAPPDDGFYDALSEHWNETTGNKLAGAVTRGAASAITGLVGEATGARFDVEHLVETLGPEAATMAVVARMREEMSPEEFHRWTGELRDHNAKNQGAAEQKAMQRHAELVRQHEDLQRQVKRGDLRSEATIATLTARNLLEQRENLGGALGSLQASASLYHFADAAKDARFRKQPVVITVGSRAALNDKIKRLGWGGRDVVRYDVSRGVYQIHTDTSMLRKFVGRTESDKGDAARWDAVKFDDSGIEHDPEGREWVPGYQVPGFRSHFGEAETLPVEQRHLAGQKIQLLADQRNNIEWLHGSGGGVVTSRTGGGKTLVSVGVASKMLHDNPRGMHLRIVPDGREEQWAAEIKNFSRHAPVVLPAVSSKAERARILASAAPGSIVIVGHTHAGRHDYDALASAHAWDSVGIDEPQELRSKSGNGKMSAGARRIFRIPAKNRHALTATPASDHPVEVYDIANWARPGALGFRSRFRRAFSGFGGGTNAQDAALQRMLYRELAPHVSGERLVPPHYNVDHHDERVETSAGQIAKQREIEGRVDQTIAAAQEDARQKKAAGVIGYADKHPSQLSREAKEKALGKLEAEHRANLSGGDVEHNPKLGRLLDSMAKSKPDARHVVFVDSADQRRAVTAALEAAGHKGKIRNITASAKGEVVKGPAGEELSAIEARKRTWKQTPGGILLIDRTSASGHNLAEGDHLHVLGSPDDAAQMLQAHGRLGRANRVGDFQISTYRYQDSPFEHLQWNRLERQLKVLRATAPGMFVEGRRAQAGPLAKALGFVLRRLGKGFQLGLFGGGAREPATKPAEPAPAKAADRVAPPPKVAPHPVGFGWLPIPGSKHGGWHRQKKYGDAWEYWYPDTGNQKTPRVSDRNSVENNDEDEDAPELVHLIHDNGERTIRRGYTREGAHSATHQLVHYGDLHGKDHKDKGIAVGSTFRSEAGEEYQVTERKEGGILTVENLTTGKSEDVASSNLVYYINRRHEKGRTEANTAFKPKIEAMAKSVVRELVTARDAFNAAPSRATLARLGDLSQSLRSLSRSLYWTAQEWAQEVGASTTEPKDWAAFASEYHALAKELQSRFVGDGWRTFANDRANIADLATSGPLLKKGARFHFLRDFVNDYGFDSKMKTLRARAGQIADRMKPNAEGNYTHYSVEQAILAAASEWSGTTFTNRDLRRVIIPTDGSLQTYGDKPETLELLRKLRAIDDYAKGSGTAVSLTVEHSTPEARDLAQRAHSVHSMLEEAVGHVAKQRGADPCPDVYGDTYEHKPITAEDIANALPGVPDYTDQKDTHQRSLEVLAAGDPILPVHVPTGEMDPPYRPDAAPQPSRQPVMAPLSLVARAESGEAKAKAEEHRAAHQERLGRLRGHLGAVEAKVGDPYRHYDAAIDAWAKKNGHKPAEIRARVGDARARRLKEGRLADAWHIGWELWKELHPVEKARYEEHYKADGAKLSADDRKAIDKQRGDFTGAFRQFVSEHTVEAIRKSIGHTSDLRAAKKAVHVAEEQPRSGAVTVTAGSLAAGGGTLENYDLAGDPGKLGKVLGWISKDVIPHVDIAVKKGLDRAHCGYDNGIRLSGVSTYGAGDSTLWHEYGHAIEHDNPAIKEMANTLRDEKGKGEHRKKLRDIHNSDGYEDHEITYEDHWESAYTGKWYGHQASTEVLSMGTEAFFADPVKFYQEDKDHFHFTVGALSGMFGGERKSVHRKAKP